MFELMSARLASSCSRNGISPALTPTICFGETSMYSTCPDRIDPIASTLMATGESGRKNPA